ncbi:hypothetical protein STEG23_023366 [Scotinomys teguina]
MQPTGGENSSINLSSVDPAYYNTNLSGKAKLLSSWSEELCFIVGSSQGRDFQRVKCCTEGQTQSLAHAKHMLYMGLPPQSCTPFLDGPSDPIASVSRPENYDVGQLSVPKMVAAHGAYVAQPQTKLCPPPRSNSLYPIREQSTDTQAN